jgi:hypothetical protein
LGFNVLVGSNTKGGGKWNAEDADILNRLIKSGNYTSQEIHDILFTQGMERFKGNGAKNIELLLKKHENMWSKDSDILWNIRSGMDEKDKNLVSFTRYFAKLSLASNFYYFVILLICGLNSFYIIKSRKKVNSGLIFLFIIISGITAVHMIMEATGRYHYPAVILFSLISAHGIVENFQKYSDK